MMEILRLMADELGYKIDEKVRDKCMGIFEAACSAPDFGNGRFVSNLLEQAEMAQSHRIAVSSRSGKITRTLLCTLKAEDFDINEKQTDRSHKAAHGVYHLIQVTSAGGRATKTPPGSALDARGSDKHIVFIPGVFLH